MSHRRDVQLEIITRALARLIPRAAPAFITIRVEETLPGRGVDSRNTWQGSVSAVAERVFTALYGRPQPVAEQQSPLTQAEDAKRAGDIHGEVGALMSGDRALRTAPWYPVRAGDLVHLHYEDRTAADGLPAYGETYAVEVRDGYPNDLQLCLIHNTASDARDLAGVFAPGDIGDPLYELWFEAGPQRLTIIRDGRVVHLGPAVPVA